MSTFKQFTLMLFIILCVGGYIFIQPSDKERAERHKRTIKANAHAEQEQYNQTRARQDREAWDKAMKEARYQESLRNR